MLPFLFLVICPVMSALRVGRPTVPEVINATDDRSYLQIDGQAPIEIDNAERVLRKASKTNKQAWITFAGDSNMRNTYWFFVTSKLNRTGVKILHSKQFGYRTEMQNSVQHDPHINNEWSDQEAIVQYPDGFEIRASFRFLHGSAHEYKFKTTNWNSASRSYTMDAVVDADKELDKIKFNTKEKKQLDEAMDDPDAIQPSQYGKWAAKHQKFIDFKKDVPYLAREFTKYQHVKPDVVILTEGWGGIPGCDRFDETLDLFKKSPEIKFVWSPIYFTNRIEKRHQCFSEKIANITQETDSKQNYKFVEMWDMAKQYPQFKVAKGMAGTKHMHIGGEYMKTGCKRLENAIEDLAPETEPQNLQSSLVQNVQEEISAGLANPTGTMRLTSDAMNGLQKLRETNAPVDTIYSYMSKVLEAQGNDQ